MSLRRVSMMLPSLLLAACGSDVAVDGMIGGLSFELNTVYGWVDATHGEIDPEAGKIVFTEREQKDLYLVLSGGTYDPEEDVRFMSADRILEIGLQEERNGRIGIEVSDSEAVAKGSVLTDPGSGGGGPELHVEHEFGLIRVDADAVYPEEAIIFGSRTTYTLTVDEIEQGPTGHVSGTIVVAVERGDSDPVGVETGSISIEFAAPLIGERIAECNHSSGQSGACELILQ